MYPFQDLGAVCLKGFESLNSVFKSAAGKLKSSIQGTGVHSPKFQQEYEGHATKSNCRAGKTK